MACFNTITDHIKKEFSPTHLNTDNVDQVSYNTGKSDPIQVKNIIIKHEQDVLYNKQTCDLSEHYQEDAGNLVCIKEEIDIGATIYIERTCNDCYKCQHCDYISDCLNSYNDHASSHMEDVVQEKSREHKVCDKKNDVIKTGKKGYECDICSKKFTRLCHFNIHMRIHTGEKPFQCEICSKKFTQVGCLNIHMKIHTGEKLYKCKLCPKKFSRASVRNLHMKTHTKEKPYECHICHKTYRAASSRDMHMIIHTGESSYECSFCQRTFARANTLKRHMRTHQTEKPYECQV